MALARSSPVRSGPARSTITGSSGRTTLRTVLYGLSRKLRLLTASHVVAHPVGRRAATAAQAMVSARSTYPPARFGRDCAGVSRRA
jgi:hypothetical protein